MIEPRVVHYASHPTQGGSTDLSADLYLLAPRRRADLVIWLHAGGFRTGGRAHGNHKRLAATFARNGVASAFIDYRLARPPAVLRPATRAALRALRVEAKAVGEEMHPTFIGPRALAVVEDCVAFLNFIHENRAEYGLGGRYILAGSSAGAISALNVLYLPEALGLTRPPIATVLSFSGGFAYPRYLHPTGARILAINAPGDERVPVSSIRRFAELTPDPVLLIESDAQAHGTTRVSKADTLTASIERCVAFHRAENPLAIPIPTAAGTG